MRIDALIRKARRELAGILDEREIDQDLSLLLRERKGYSKSDIILNKEEELSDEDERWLEECLGRLKKNEPLQYILGTTEFYGMELKCDRRALIPRPETEEMVEKAVHSMTGDPQRILDLGTGNGCIALALKKAFPDAEVHAVDNSHEAIDLAKENAEALGLDLLFHKDELYPTALSGSLTFDLLLSNPPYVAQEEREELSERVRAFEPDEALFVPGEDPFEPYRSVLRSFKERGSVSAELWMELNPLHADRVLELMQEYGLSNGRIEKDLSGKRRFAYASF